MKAFAVLGAALAIVGLSAAFASQADAQHAYYPYRYPALNHQRHHDDLDHRSFHRELEHREAHRYPMTGRQHGRLHDSLDHDAFHDHLEHRSAHRSGAYYVPRQVYRPSYGYGYSPYGSGFGISGRNFSLWFGR